MCVCVVTVDLFRFFGLAQNRLPEAITSLRPPMPFSALPQRTPSRGGELMQWVHGCAGEAAPSDKALKVPVDVCGVRVAATGNGGDRTAVEGSLRCQGEPVMRSVKARPSVSGVALEALGMVASAALAGACQARNHDTVRPATDCGWS